MSKFLLSVVLVLGSMAGFAAATSPPPPDRPFDTGSCCYSNPQDAEYEGDLELQGGNYVAYEVVRIDDDHWQLCLWASRD